MRKADVLSFLHQFHKSLERDLPPVPSLRSAVRTIASSAKNDDTAPHMRRPEEAFLNTYAIPRLFKNLQIDLGLSEEEARLALLSENFRHMRTMCSGSPARKERHPFDKALARDPREVMLHWQSGKSNSLRQSCPDFALRAPCPFSIVFEGKYFEEGSGAKAEADLVTNIYQAFFYQALPKIAGTNNRPPWDYEFSCLLACDASRDGTLKQAWESLAPAVQAGFWDGANVYVMILRSET